MKKILKKAIPISMKIKIKQNLEYLDGYKKTKYLYENSKDKQRIILIGTPDHDNLGDHAIAYAEHEFIKRYFSEAEIIEITTGDINKNLKALRKYINKNDVFIYHGGGNIGDAYLYEEEGRRKIILNFLENKIIIFPQTIYFTETEIGRREFEITKKTYNSNYNLSIIARETKSYEIMKQAFPNNKIILTPDIVTFLKKTDKNIERKGTLLCIRKDKESILTDEIKINIKEIVSKYYDDIVITDTSLDHMISIEKRNEELQKKWYQFQSSELVVTDRLHGMVFAAITSTPCIAIGNYNYKVKGTYEWIKHLNYIRFVDGVDDIEKNIEELKKVNIIEYNNEFTKKYFQQIINIINIKEVNL